MATHDDRAKIALGFLTVVEHPDHGLFGGYLLLGAAGRPLEFHCTAPIKPNRAQEILYGPTLAPFLYGEQIGRTLLAKSKTDPMLVFTDREAMLAVREYAAMPVALVLSSDAPTPGAGWTAFEVQRNRLSVPAQSDGDRPLIIERLTALADSFDLAEPFDRIREAIDEAQRAVHPAARSAA